MQKTFKTAVLGLLLSCLFATAGSYPEAVGERLSISVTNKYGDVFTNLTVARILYDGLLLEHKAGQVKVKYEDLPQELREKYAALAVEAKRKAVEEGQANAAFVARQEAEKARGAASRAGAEPKKINVEIPNQGWRISLLNPGFASLRNQINDGQYVCEGYTEKGFIISIFVEKPAGNGMSNDDVFHFYWPKASRNPLIDRKSVKFEKLEKFVKVSYRSAEIPNVNYYFAFKGKWVDVHISRFPSAGADEKLFADFEAHLSYAE